MKVLIIGGVAGGASAAARLRRLDEQAHIIMFERGEYISYANCGLPYHVGDVITDRAELLLMTPELMKERHNIDVRVRQEVVAIDRAARTVTVRMLPGEETYQEGYDRLIIATGSSPLRPPIPGIDSPRIQTLWTVPDTDRIRQTISSQGITTAAVVGGGFIGLEMAENLHLRGIQVTVLEAMDQVMAPIDPELAEVLHGELRAQGVDLVLSDGVASFEDTGKDVAITLKSGRVVNAQLVILSIGVRPNSQLAKDAGLELNPRGGIVVDRHLRTSDHHIYAVGDVIQVEDLVLGGPAMVPLAGPANKQGRIAADNIAGAAEVYRGTQGSSVVKLFGLTVGATGANEKTLQRLGQVRGKDYDSVLIAQNHHAGYYPGAEGMFIKLLFSADGQRILGAQIVGGDGVDKRIDVLATALRLKATVQDLTELELAYAPPYSSAKDPVNMAGFTAQNVLKGMDAFAPWDALDKEEDAHILDVRDQDEVEEYALPRYTHIPLGQLRDRLHELPRDKDIIVVCARGVRAHNAARMMKLHGIDRVRIYPGGTDLYWSTHRPAAAHA